MSQQSDDCTEIIIENITESIDPVSAVLAAIFGLIFGILLGFLIYYLYATCVKSDTTRSEKHKHEHKENVKTKNKLSGNPYANFFTHYSSPNDHHTPGLKKRNKFSGKVYPVAIANEQLLEESELTLNFPTLSKIVLHRIHENEKSALRLLSVEELGEFHCLDIEFWAMRIWCVKSITKLTLNTLVTKGLLKKKDAKSILNCHTNLAKDMDTAVEKLKVFLAAYKTMDNSSLLDICQGRQDNLFEIIKEVCMAYFMYWNMFKIQLENFVQPEMHEVIVQELNQAFLLIESSVSTQLETISTSIKQIYKRIQVILQTMSVADMSGNVQEKYFTAKKNTILTRLVKSGRISSDTKDELMREDEEFENEKLKNKRKSKNQAVKHEDEILLTHEEKVKDLSEKTFAKLNKVLVEMQKEQEKTLQYNTADEKIKLQDFLTNFLQIRTLQNQKKYDYLLQEVTRETNDMLKLIEDDVGVKNEDMGKKIHGFCKDLLDKDALDEAECESMKNELEKDVRQYHVVAYKNLQATVHHMWQKLDKNQKEQNAKDNGLAMVLLNDIISEDSKNTNFLVDNFPHFPIDKSTRIFQEREVVLTLLGNLINSNRIQWIHVFECDLVECQWRVLKEKQDALAENKIQKTEQILEILWSERNQMLNYPKDMITCTSMYAIIQICGSILSCFIAHEVIKILRPEKMENLFEKTRMNEVSTLLEDAVKKTDEDIQSKIPFLTQKYRLESKDFLKPVLNNFKSQVQGIVEESKEKQTLAETKLKEVIGSIQTQPGYDGMILEHDLIMEINDLDQRSSLLQHQAVLELRKSYDRSIALTLSEVKKAHMCKIASECGLSKKQFAKLVEHGALNAYSTHDEIEEFVQSFMCHWTTNQNLNSRRKKKIRNNSQSYYD